MKYSLHFVLLASLLYAACSNKTSPSNQNAVSTTSVTVSTPQDKILVNGKIEFEASNNNYNAKGEFKKWHFTQLNMNKNDIESLNASLQIDLTSVWEKSPQLTSHLKAPDFFDVGKYANAKLDISKVRKKEKNLYEADLRLEMKNNHQLMTTEFTVINESPLTVQGTALVERNIFNLGPPNGMMGLEQMIKVSYLTELPN